MSQAIDLTIGRMRPDELSFVAKSWKLSLQDAPQNEGVDPGVFFGRANRDFDRILARPDVEVLVARDAEHPSVILGFVCIERHQGTLALHYAYTRSKGYRRQGVCSSLLEHALQGSKDERLVYTSGSRFDAMWENWGMERVDLARWLRGAKQ